MSLFSSQRVGRLRDVLFGGVAAATLAVAASTGFVNAPAHAETVSEVSDPFLVRKESPYSVKETLDRVVRIVEERGGTVFARIDHAQGAASIFETLRPTEVLVFGNPAGGTPLMQRNQEAAIDLPLRLLAYEDADGAVILAYRPIEITMTPHGLSQAITPLEPIQKVLERLTDAAVRAD